MLTKQKIFSSAKNGTGKDMERSKKICQKWIHIYVLKMMLMNYYRYYLYLNLVNLLEAATATKIFKY